MLSNQKPLDFLLVMLCSNDLLQGNSVEAVAQRMEAFLTRIPLENSQIVLIGPPRIRPRAFKPYFQFILPIIILVILIQGLI